MSQAALELFSPCELGQKDVYFADAGNLILASAAIACSRPHESQLIIEHRRLGDILKTKNLTSSKNSRRFEWPQLEWLLVVFAI